jgi:polygalacturonase
MKRALFIFTLLTTSYAIPQEPSPDVFPVTPRRVEAEKAGASGQTSAYLTKSVLNVRDYGVSCGGTTDDTSAMEDAINAACNTGVRGKTLILPSSCPVKVTSAQRKQYVTIQ